LERFIKEIIKETFKEYLKKKKKERILSMAGSLKEWEIKDGLEYEKEIREEDIKTQEEREKYLIKINCPDFEIHLFRDKL